MEYISKKKHELESLLFNDPFFGDALKFSLSQISTFSGINVLDAACGSGIISIYLALCGAKVIGVDIDKASLEMAQNLAIEYNVLENVKFICSSVESLDIENSSVDVVFSRTSLHYTNITKTLEEMKRVLKKNGDMILIENLPYNPLINIYRIIRRIKAKTAQEIAYVESIKKYMTFREIKVISKSFHEYSEAQYHIFRVISIGLLLHLKFSFFAIYVDNCVAYIDKILLDRLPPLRKFAWFTVVVYKNHLET